MYTEIEVRFLEINKEALIDRLKQLNAKDLGEVILDERIIYDDTLSWRENGKFLRLRTSNGHTKLAYKHRTQLTVDGVEEIEFEVSNVEAAEALLDRLGYKAYRHQQKKRHTFTLENVTVDIDTWPRIPTYVELEGSSEDDLKKAAALLDLDWNNVELRTPTLLIEEKYQIPVSHMKWFTFERFE